MEITPLIPAGRQVIQAYGAGGFKISGAAHRGAVLVLPGATLPWSITEISQLTLDSLAPVTGASPMAEILVLGCGPHIAFVSPELREALRGHGISLEVMDTGAACRTYNVLVAEDRRVAAALIPVE
ncbi:MAG: Mth938-like domain-containing protein [Alphaproteobacteria bacterium]|nr:Mth938-like domain-containing protein [Alphaproteobacteria bacterium]